MKKLLALLLVFLSIQLIAQTDTVRIEHYSDGSSDTLSISLIDSITFGYVTVSVNYRISGKVFDSLNNVIDSGNVFLLRLNQGSEADTVQVATLDPYGAYEFEQVNPGLYLLRVEVSAVSLNTISTYYPDEFLWGDAQTLNLVQDTSDMDIHIIQLSTPSSTGSGMISGCLVEGSSFRGPSDPIDSIVIGLIRPNVSNDIYMLDETDSAGCFSFKNLADGDYALYPDIAGIPLDTAGWSNINISGSDTETVQVIADSNVITLINHSIPIDIEGYTYKTVVIGTQEWFAENLRTTKYSDGSPINYPGADSAIWVDDTIGAYTWYNNDSTTYASTYGALYNWYSTVNPAGLCPTGWHVPSDLEWNVLENYLETNGYNYDGSITGNKYAKAMADSVFWTFDVVQGCVGNIDYSTYRNKSGFSGLPGARRNSIGNFFGLGGNLFLWSSSGYNTYEAYYRNLYFSNPNVIISQNLKVEGFSVRCLRD